MNTNQRLADLADILDLLYEKLGSFQKALVIRDSDAARFELKQRIRREILPDIRQYEQEYWEIYPSDAIIISEEEATTQLVQVQTAVDAIYSTNSNYPTQLLSLLTDIQAKLNDLDRSASAKFKVVLPLIPMIASYELEIDTKGFMYKTWEAIKRLVGR
jgi:hypothetical protein